MHWAPKPPVDLYALLMALHGGGQLVSMAHCDEEEIESALGGGRLFIDKDGRGYIFRRPAGRSPGNPGSTT